MAQIDITPIPNETTKVAYNLLDSRLSNAPPIPLTYPLDLDNYGHAVQFQIFDYDYGDISNYYSNVTGAAMGVAESAQNFSSLLNLGSSIGNLFLNIGNLFRSDQYQGKKGANWETINLYMPDTLQTSYDSDYSTVSLTNAFGLTGYLANAIADRYKSVADFKFSKEELSNLINSDFGKLVGAGLAGGLAGSLKGSAQDTTALILQAMKMSPNPQLQLIYKNVGLREFQFSFVFTPSNQQEATVVDKIINRFNYYSLPYLHYNGGNFSQYLTPPQIFNIKFIPLLGGESKIFSIGDCVLTNIAVDYAPNGWSVYQDNHPVETRMNLMFREMNMRTKADETLI